MTLQELDETLEQIEQHQARITLAQDKFGPDAVEQQVQLNAAWVKLQNEWEEIHAYRRVLLETK